MEKIKGYPRIILTYIQRGTGEITTLGCDSIEIQYSAELDATIFAVKNADGGTFAQLDLGQIIKMEAQYVGGGN